MFYLVLMVAAIGEIIATRCAAFGRRPLAGPPELGWLVDKVRLPWAVAIPIAGLATLFGLQSCLMQHFVVTQAEGWQQGFPLAVVDSRWRFDLDRVVLGPLLGGLAVVNSGLLFWLYRALLRPAAVRFGAAFVVCAAVVMAAIALLTPTVTSSDMYLYVGYSLLGHAAYQPPDVPFDGEFGIINLLRGTPVFPALYGPLGIGLAGAVLAPVATLTGKLLVLRWFNVGLIALVAILLRKLGMSWPAVALFAINPAIIFEFVVNGHNDLLALSFVVAAAVAVRRSPIGGVALAACAGLVKLPFMLLALLAFASVSDRRRRVVLGSASVALSVGASWWLGGEAYVGALRNHLGEQASAAIEVHALAAAWIGCMVLIAFIAGRYFTTATHGMAALSTVLYPWYASWGLPYAMSDERRLTGFLIGLPVLAFLLNTVVDTLPYLTLALALALLVTALQTLRFVRQAEVRATAP